MTGGFFLMLALFAYTGNFIKDAKALTYNDTVIVKKTVDFPISGRGDNEAWTKTSWQTFSRVDTGGRNYESRSKILYSEKGVYLLFEGEDELVTTKDYQDDDEIYEGDVYEFFLQTEKGKSYFEYEINQLGRHLILTLSGTPHKNLAWSPWRHEYKKDPLIQKEVFIEIKNEKAGKVVKPGAIITSWSAEIFFPYELFSLLPGGIPKPGTVWHANFCRIDYDSGKMVQWSWSRKIKRDFHELENFGTILFE